MLGAAGWSSSEQQELSIMFAQQRRNKHGDLPLSDVATLLEKLGVEREALAGLDRPRRHHAQSLPFHWLQLHRHHPRREAERHGVGHVQRCLGLASRARVVVPDRDGIAWRVRGQHLVRHARVAPEDNQPIVKRLHVGRRRAAVEVHTKHTTIGRAPIWVRVEDGSETTLPLLRVVGVLHVLRAISRVAGRLHLGAK